MSHLTTDSVYHVVMRFYEPVLGVCLALLFTTPATAIEVGEIAPDFTMTDIVTLEDFSLSEFHGQVVVLNFWAYW
jgi:hypothetical protein